MDDTDHRLLALLRTDARRPISSLALDLGISRATVRARMQRLLDDGVIQGFTVVLRAGKGAHGIRAITMVEVAGPSAERLIRRLQGFPEVRTLSTTNGRWDIVAEIETASLEALDDILRRIRLLEGIAGTETSILLSTRKGMTASGGEAVTRPAEG